MRSELSLSRRDFSLLLAAAPTALAVTAPTSLPAAQVEKFLSEAKALSSKSISVGITGVKRVLLSDGTLTHDGHFQCIDEAKTNYQTVSGSELNFRDTYKFNIAGYRLDRMLELHMTPPSIERPYNGQTGAMTWWLPAGLMESERTKRKINPPDTDFFNKQIYALRVFDQLIFNTDRNLQNLLLTPDGKVWMIDHTRAFRLHHDLKAPKDLVKCERKLLENLRKLESAALTSRMGDFLRPMEIDSLLKRRDKIVAIFEQKAAKMGAGEVYYDLPSRPAEYPVEFAVDPWAKKK